MNLKELLLQFAGDNERSLRLEDILVGHVKGVKIEEDVCNGIRMIVFEPERIEEITERVQKLLEHNNYDGYSITEEESNGIYHLLIEEN